MQPRTVTNGYSDERVVFGAYRTDDDGVSLYMDGFVRLPDEKKPAPSEWSPHPAGSIL